MTTVIGCDAGNQVRLVNVVSDTQANPAGTIPGSWNGMPLTAYVLTAAQASAFAGLPADNGGATFNGSTFAPLAAPAAVPAPTVTALAAAGTGPTVQVVSGSNDQLGAVRITAGTTPAAGQVATLTFGTAKTAAPMVVQVGAMNVRAGVLTALSVTTTGFTFDTTATPVAGTTYTLWWHVA